MIFKKSAIFAASNILIFTMKKISFFLSFSLVMVFLASCSTKVDLYADYKDIPVIYGLLDATQDTNFIRINKAFSGNDENPVNANEVSLIADSCNYPGKLKAYLIEYKNVYGNVYTLSGRDTIKLDTITLHDKQEGFFYAPNQKVYFTTAVFKQNTDNTHYKYKLFVHLGNDTVTSETELVGGEGFKILTNNAAFTSTPNERSQKIKFNRADNAVVYDVKMAFHYTEQKGNSPIVNKQVTWKFGSKSTDELSIDESNFYVSYAENSLFSLLEAAIGNDTIGVTRLFASKPIEISIAAGGEELFNYIQVNALSGSFSQTIPDYTNVIGGYGVFSSRVNITKFITLSSRATSDLYGKNWGFQLQQ